MDKLPSYYGFSVVVINDSGTILKKDVLSTEELMETARSCNVEAIAVDNVFELGPEGEIRRISVLLPNVDIIQVTGSPGEGFRPLSAVGKELGLAGGEKLSPSRSAEICAKAAFAGVGSLVRLFEPETRVSISRRRRFGTGGMSEGRYRRSIQGSVLNLTNSIEASLKSRGIDFDLNLRKGSHGVEGSTFFVYASRNRLIGLVRPLRTSSINVRVVPVYTKALEYEPLRKGANARPKRHLIVGVDPGMVTGLAAMDLNGRILGMNSGRGITRGQMTRWISELGKAIAIASDVNPAPALVAKLAASHGAILFTPEASLKTSEKKALAERASQDQGAGVEDTHQRAALAAALKAFAFYRNKLEQAGSHVRREGKAADLDEVKANVLRGMSINDAIEASRLPVYEERLPARRRLGTDREQIRVLEAKCADLRGERDRLEEKMEALESKVDDLENELRLTRLEPKPKRTKEGEIYELERRLSSLQGENTSLRGKAELLQSELLSKKAMLKGVASGTHAALMRYSTLATAMANVHEGESPPFLVAKSVGILDESSKRRLKGTGALAVILAAPTSEDLDLLWDVGMPVIHLSWLNSEPIGDVDIIGKAELEESLVRAKKAMEESSLAKGKNFRQIFDDYKKERMKGA
jgi:predicted RNase H-like nuclease (RuvC/YqgF family)